MNNRSMLFLALFVLAVFLAAWLDVTTHVKIAFTNLIYGEEMRSFKGFRVTVEPLLPEIEKAGLASGEILAAVGARLQKAGIESLGEEEWRQTPGQPTLTLTVQATKTGENLFEYTVLMLVEKSVAPHRGTQQQEIEAKIKSLWIATGVGKGGTADLRAKINEVVDQFLQAHAGK